MLTEHQIDFIQAELDKSKITIPEIKEDLLDHFCCSIEHEMLKGLSFETSYQIAFKQVCPNGLDEIQIETLYMLNSKKVIVMKKIMYSIGLLSSMSMGIGYLFKIMHWPGADNIFSYGFFGLVFLFLPMFTIDWYKENLNQVLSEKLKIILGFTSAIIMGLGLLMKTGHIYGASITIGIGMLLFILGFLPFLFFRMYRKSVE